MAFFKIIMGKIGYSQALIADGIHSFADLASDALVFFAVRASVQHPDKEHPYGHQRIETLATTVIGFILLLVAAALCNDAAQQLIHKTFETPSIWVVIVAIFSMIGNEWLFHYSKKQGENIHSNLLISNAWHKRSDVWVSLIVLFSVVGSLLGWHWLDAIGAIIIALVILKMAVTMIWQSVQELIDRGVDEQTLEKIKNTVHSVSGVRSIHQLRTRLHGSTIFVDLHIIVDPFISVSEGHHIGESVHLKLLNTIKNLQDVTVHIDPEDDDNMRPSLRLPHREAVTKIITDHCASLIGFSQIQKIILHYIGGHLTVEIFMHCDAIKDFSLPVAVAQYRAALRTIPAITHVTLHCSTDL
jgi:cation diffusion facilitator family transporter